MLKLSNFNYSATSKSGTFHFSFLNLVPKVVLSGLEGGKTLYFYTLLTPTSRASLRMFTVILIDAFSEMFQLHIVDLDPSSVTTGGWLEDTSLVEKYNISEEDYANRTDSFRKFKEKRVSQNPAASEVKVTYFCLDVKKIFKVGDRCQVEAGEKRGVVKYVGRAESLGPGYWVGIQYDEPLGKHDGMLVRILKETLYVKPEKGV
ncbi:unnamed protein product [Brassica oleracea]